MFSGNCLSIGFADALGYRQPQQYELTVPLLGFHEFYYFFYQCLLWFIDTGNPFTRVMWIGNCTHSWCWFSFLIPVCWHFSSHWPYESLDSLPCPQDDGLRCPVPISLVDTPGFLWGPSGSALKLLRPFPHPCRTLKASSPRKIYLLSLGLLTLHSFVIAVTQGFLFLTLKLSYKFNYIYMFCLIQHFLVFGVEDKICLSVILTLSFHSKEA